MPPPAPPQLEFFVDRSLGRLVVPDLLREGGLRVVTLAETYGIPGDENVADVRWLADAGRKGQVVLMKDTRVRYNVAEKAVVVEHKVRCFCLTSANLSGPEMAQRFLGNLRQIAQACAEPGPFIYAVHEKRIQRLVL